MQEAYKTYFKLCGKPTFALRDVNISVKRGKFLFSVTRVFRFQNSVTYLFPFKPFTKKTCSFCFYSMNKLNLASALGTYVTDLCSMFDMFW